LHDYSTRAQQHNRHPERGRIAATAVAVLLVLIAITILSPSLARSTPTSAVELTSAPDIMPEGMEAAPGHDVAIEIVAPGSEGLELNARLTDDGGFIEVPLHWAIRNMDGDIVYAGYASEAKIPVPPGDYAVDIRFDALKLSSTVTLLEGNRLMVSYVLNAGGLRILPRVKDVGLPAATPLSRIFALTSSERGRLVAVSDIPGEVIRIPEGDYRIESRFAAGNVAAVTDVHVTAGRMSAVEIDHRAGLARLAFVGTSAANVTWNVRDGAGLPIARATGQNTDVVLRPGTYTATAEAGGKVLTTTFDIASGEARDIYLGQ